MDEYTFNKNKNKGEVALIYVFIILSIMIVSAFTLSAIAISTIKGSGVAEYVARAQIASDSYLEKAMFQFHWSVAADSESTRCLNTVISDIGDGTKITVMVDDGEVVDGGAGLFEDCPSLDDVLQKNKSLCVYSFAENHGVLKKQLAGAGKERDPITGLGGCPVR